MDMHDLRQHAIAIEQGLPNGAVSTAEVEELERDIATAANEAGRGPVGLALNVAKTAAGAAVGQMLRGEPQRAAEQVGIAIGWLLRARESGGAVGCG